jgi:DNA-binding GntR family transcriptional regulator
MKPKTYLAKLTINNLLDRISKAIKENDCLTSDAALAESINVSRATIRVAVAYLVDKDILQRSPLHKIILRKPKKSDYFVLDFEDSTKEIQVETFFLDLIMSAKLKPGDRFSELELAQQSGCTTGTIREFLLRFSSNRLIEKIPRCGWKIAELNETIIVELTAFREMLELRLLGELLQLPKSDPVWDKLQKILTEHLELQKSFDGQYMDFLDLDRRLHFTMLEATQNRYLNKFYENVFFISRYYFIWGKQDKVQNIKTAIQEHIELLNNILSNNNADSILTMQTHMNTTQKNLLDCVNGLHQET